MKIFLIRHGEAAQSWDQSADPGLSELGKEQALECSVISMERKISINLI